jgi:long-chain acyl-CoA synthetase
MLITELLKKNATLYGDDIALVSVYSNGLIPFDDTSYEAHRSAITWCEFNEKANQVANFYNSIGIGKGNKVGVLLMNCIHWLPIYFGIIKSGAVVVPLNFRYETADIIWSTNFADVDALVLGTRCVKQVQMSLPEIPRIRSYVFVGKEELCPAFATYFKHAFGKSAKSEPNNHFTAEDDAAIYFSSGTTGAPKAVVYTNGTLEAACAREQSIHGQTKNDSFICIPPLYHVGAKLHWMGNLLVGAKGVLLLGFTVPAFFETMSREQVTIAFLLLPWAQDILLNLDTEAIKLENFSLENWRLLHMGAQCIPPSVVRRLKTYFPNLDYDISYGLTESGGPGCLNLGINNLHKLGSVGRPAPGWRAKIVDDKSNETKQGEPGELLVKGPHMMRCYYKDKVTTNSVLVDGWLHTGDVAKKDSDGFYYIVDRKKDIIISGGENIYPVQIEVFLRAYKPVKDVAVFGVRHRRLGEVVVALVELNPGTSCTEEELLEFCKSLPKYKRPRKIVFGDVPRNPTGKIEKFRLREKYSAENLDIV